MACSIRPAPLAGVAPFGFHRVAIEGPGGLWTLVGSAVARRIVNPEGTVNETRFPARAACAHREIRDKQPESQEKHRLPSAVREGDGEMLRGSLGGPGESHRSLSDKKAHPSVTLGPLRPHRRGRVNLGVNDHREGRNVNVIVFVGLSLGLAGLMIKACQVAISAHHPGRD